MENLNNNLKMYPTKTSVKLTYTPTLLISRNIFKWEWFFVFSTNLITRANDFTQLLKRMWRTQKHGVKFHEFFCLTDFTWNQFSWIKLETRPAHFSRFLFLARCEKKPPISREKLFLPYLKPHLNIIWVIFKTKLLP